MDIISSVIAGIPSDTAKLNIVLDLIKILSSVTPEELEDPEKLSLACTNILCASLLLMNLREE